MGRNLSGQHGEVWNALWDRTLKKQLKGKVVLEACVVPACVYGSLLFVSESIYNRSRL